MVVCVTFTVLMCAARSCLKTLRDNQRLALADGTTVHALPHEAALLLPLYRRH